jgi:glycosyltransferase involved in cell wall biosynthesis
LIVGDGPERKNLETQAKQMGAESGIIFTGLLAYNDIPHYLAASDLFISASITEVFPLTIIEAKAAGLPVLGIDSPGIIDIIEDGNTGVISKNEFSDFTSKLLHLSNDHEMRQKMGRQARQSIEKYDINSSTGLLLSHYRRLVANAQHNQNSQDKGHHRTDNLS